MFREIYAFYIDLVSKAMLDIHEHFDKDGRQTRFIFEGDLHPIKLLHLPRDLVMSNLEIDRDRVDDEAPGAL
jgi:hypothetical protein